MTIVVKDANGANQTVLTPNELAAAFVAAIEAATAATQPISASALPLPTGAASAAAQATLIGHVDGIEAALANLGTQTTLASILAKIIATPATEAKQDAAIAAINGLVGNEYETVAASQTDQVLGAAGAIGDLLVGLLIIPTSTSPGAVSIKDGPSGTPIPVFAGGASSITTLHPFSVLLNIKCGAAGWRVTTGAGVSVIGVGNFT